MLPMKLSTLLPAACSSMIVLGVASCGSMRSAGNSPSGTGPFDSRGNYIEAWADNPAKWRGGDRKPTPPRATTSRPAPAVASTPPAARPTTQTASRPTPTAKPKPKPKPKPQPKRYTVKRGDTLSAISRRYRTSVAALRRANGISGDLIRPGQVLRIP